MVLATSSRDVKTAMAADKPGTMVRLYLPDMRRNLSHTTAVLVDQNRLEIKSLNEVCFTSRMTRWSSVRMRLENIRLSFH
jgi:hypothetical protein